MMYWIWFVSNKFHISAHPEGREILKDKPRVNTVTWNFERLLDLPHNTFGYQYAQWMGGLKFTPDERPVVKYVPDLELAYIL